MQINVQIYYAEGDVTMTPNELANAFLKAAGGDESKDTCTVQLSATGQGGFIPPPPTP